MTNREKLIAAAENLFDRHGFIATGVDRLTEAAGMSSRTLYKHAGSKVALMTAVLNGRNARFMSAIDVASVDDLFAALGQWQRSESMRGCMLLRALAETGGEIAEIAETFDVHKAEFRERIAAIVATDLGVTRDNVLAEQVLVLFEGAMISAVYRGTEAVQAARSAAAVLVAAARR
jgi:AcrR family transcriptional regulator